MSARETTLDNQGLSSTEQKFKSQVQKTNENGDKLSEEQKGELLDLFYELKDEKPNQIKDETKKGLQKLKENIDDEQIKSEIDDFLTTNSSQNNNELGIKYDLTKEQVDSIDSLEELIECSMKNGGLNSIEGFAINARLKEKLKNGDSTFPKELKTQLEKLLELIKNKKLGWDGLVSNAKKILNKINEQPKIDKPSSVSRVANPDTSPKTQASPASKEATPPTAQASPASKEATPPKTQASPASKEATPPKTQASPASKEDASIPIKVSMEAIEFNNIITLEKNRSGEISYTISEELDYNSFKEILKEKFQILENYILLLESLKGDEKGQYNDRIKEFYKKIEEGNFEYDDIERSFNSLGLKKISYAELSNELSVLNYIRDELDEFDFVADKICNEHFDNYLKNEDPSYELSDDDLESFIEDGYNQKIDKILEKGSIKSDKVYKKISEYKKDLVINTNNNIDLIYDSYMSTFRDRLRQDENYKNLNDEALDRITFQEHSVNDKNGMLLSIRKNVKKSNISILKLQLKHEILSSYIKDKKDIKDPYIDLYSNIKGLKGILAFKDRGAKFRKELGIQTAILAAGIAASTITMGVGGAVVVGLGNAVRGATIVQKIGSASSALSRAPGVLQTGARVFGQSSKWLAGTVIEAGSFTGGAYFTDKAIRGDRDFDFNEFQNALMFFGVGKLAMSGIGKLGKMGFGPTSKVAVPLTEIFGSTAAIAGISLYQQDILLEPGDWNRETFAQALMLAVFLKGSGKIQDKIHMKVSGNKVSAGYPPRPKTGTGTSTPSPRPKTGTGTSTPSPRPKTGTGTSTPSPRPKTGTGTSTPSPRPKTGTGTSTPSPRPKTGTGTSTPSPRPKTGTGTSTPSPRPKTGTGTSTPSPRPKTGTGTSTPSPRPKTGTGTSTPSPRPKTGTGTSTPSPRPKTGTGTSTPSPRPKTGTGTSTP